MQTVRHVCVGDQCYLYTIRVDLMYDHAWFATIDIPNPP